MIFCEPFAGSAAVTYRLLSRYGKPPISYMGAKTGFADTILACLGLRPGQGAAGVVLGDVGPWAAVHACLGGASGVSAREVAGFLHANAISMVKDGNARGYSHVNGEGHEFVNNSGKREKWTATTPGSTAARCGGPGAPAVANIIRSWANEEPRALWDRLKAEGWPGLLPVEGGRWMGPVDVGEVARWVWCGMNSYRRGDPDSGADIGERANPKDNRNSGGTTQVSSEVDGAPTFPPLACWQGRAEDMALPDDLTGWVMLVDPPYSGTTKYPHGDCDRATVLRLVQGWSERGAVVAVCEAEPLDLPGWDVVRIDHARVGAKRTFSRQQSEYLTLNRASAYVPPMQVGLFA